MKGAKAGRETAVPARRLDDRGMGMPRRKYLKASSVKQPTLVKYKAAVGEFFLWSKSNSKYLGSISAVDEAMVLFFTDLCEDARPYNNASYCLYGWLCLKADEDAADKALLNRARGALKGWRSRFPGSSRFPVALAVFDLFALFFCEIFEFEAAAAVIIQVDGYLRPSEAVDLIGADVIKPVPFLSAHVWGVILGNASQGKVTKTGQIDDTVLFNTPSRLDTNAVMSAVADRRTGTPLRLFPTLSLARYEALFRRASKHFGLEKLRITPHCARHSAPSQDVATKERSIEEVQARGRWLCSKSVQRYRKPGRLLQRTAEIPSAVLTRAHNARPTVIAALTSRIWSA